MQSWLLTHPLAAQKKYRSFGLSSARPASQIDCLVVFWLQPDPGIANCRLELKPAAAHANVRFVSVRKATKSRFLYVADFSWPAMAQHFSAVSYWFCRNQAGVCLRDDGRLLLHKPRLKTESNMHLSQRLKQA